MKSQEHIGRMVGKRPDELQDDLLDGVTGGAKTIVNIDDTKMASGYLTLEIEGETVTLYKDGENGFKGIVHGTERTFTDDEVAALLKQMM